MTDEQLGTSGRDVVAERLEKLEIAYQECQRHALANDFSAAVMHEVNNPLEAITNLVYLAQHSEAMPEVQGYLGHIQEQLQVLTNVAHSSLAFHKGQSEARELRLMEIAESALKLHFARLQRSNIRVETQYCEDSRFHGVGSEILQVVSNLVLNAADALSGTSDAMLRVQVHRTGNRLELVVEDNGPGVPSELEGKLFEAHATGKKTGTGMGLWVSERIARKHGGEITFRTDRNAGRSGTAFTVAFPV